MSLRAASALAAVVMLLPLLLAGCADSASGPEKVQTTIRDLGGDPQTAYEQPVLFNALGSQDIRQQTIHLVPAEGGPGFAIVDEQGRTYHDYDDFLINNALTD